MDSPSRRAFLASVAAASLAAAKPPAVARPAKRVVFVLMSGSPSQFETFDPKPGVPTGGPFGTIPTRVPGVRFNEYLPRLASMTDRLAVVRSVTGATAAGDHVADLRRTLTGHAGPSKVGVQRPAFGAIVSHLLGDPSSKLPGYVNLSGSWHDAAFQGAGALGAKHEMMKVPGFGKPLGATSRHPSMDGHSFAARDELRDELAGGFLGKRSSRAAKLYEESFSRARGLMGSAGVFDLDREPARTRERYGPTRYGTDLLTARRLLEAGVPFVLVQCFGTRCDWDWHYEAFSHLSKYMLGVFDQATTALVEDLQARGMWDETLLVCAGEFGRTPQIGSNEANGYNGRAHWGKTYSVLLGGGPIKGGAVYGSTNKDGSDIADKPVTIPDLYRAVLWPALGVNPDKKIHVAGQPVPIQEEGARTVPGLLA
ncbi:MAG: DUF1501 domain-containing protein [Gemmataceae bacterium]|nr:DUF1501 domain-containing protein [Gemmataceae bacterium]